MIALPERLVPLGEHLIAHGARPVIVGGFVRDALLGRACKDIDVEVYGLADLDALAALLTPFGRIVEAGRSFGVLKLRLDTYELDLSLPRTERKTGSGHRGFTVQSESTMAFETAARRRDFTINAMGFDLLTRTLLDPFGGRDDLIARRLAHVDADTFVEDPLRVLRAMQFIARYDLRPSEALLTLCREMVAADMLGELPKERVFEEFRKLLLKAPTPSAGLRFLEAVGGLRHFPELLALRGVEQDPLYHPEGDVWEHTLLALDAMAARRGDDEDEALVLMLAVLCHDLGKPATTAVIDGRIRALGHESAGRQPTERLLRRLTDEQRLPDEVLPLVEHHLKPMQLFKARAKAAALRRLSTRVNLRRLIRVAEADFFGRTSPEAQRGRFEAGEWLEREAQALRVIDEAPRPLLLGRDLVARGLEPSPEFKPILDAAYDAQLEGDITDHAGALRWLDTYMNNR